MIFRDFRGRYNFICFYIQGVIESCTDMLTTSYWLHVELEKNI
jgi:predicted phosphoadenosine phosphosulfate sulfurtransferase